MFSGHDLRNAPPVFFSPCRKEDGPRREASPLGRPSQKKRAPNAMNPCTARKPGIAIVERGAALVQSLYLLTQPSAKARLRSRRCLEEKRTTLTPLPGESNGGSADPPWPFQLGRVKGGRDASQTCRWHVCSQSGEQAMLATRAREYGIFPSLVAFLLQLFFGQSKKS